MMENPGSLTTSSKKHNLTEFQDLETKEGELYLRFYVTAEREFALPATIVREVISAPLDRITPIPNASYSLLGTMNLRGRVIWVADLSYVIGETSPLNTERSEMPVIAIAEQDTMVGLAVDRIVGMEWLDGEKVQTHQQALSEKVTNFVKGEWLLDERTHKSLQLLDQTAIIQSELWAA
ncbi:chemotaxis protein CheW [Aliterella atlantica]|uniref:Chemotaxis protein n=1 Tax=Aliterella atlantica CENA595 TaxID=1618023 RepID=A0A0D8ZYK8_9CYAN|nr:chemotaxis protein CheW [Aliterella atlantica]KJH73492.1 chemotaxis protein [Aliterella atlantica CENA595]